MADQIQVDLDLSEFTAALRQYVVESRLEVQDAVNKKAGDVAFAATKHLPKREKTLGEINRFGKGNKLFHSLATGKTKSGISTKGAAVKGKGNKKIADAIFASRKRHVSYSSSLFLYLAQKFGKKVRALKKMNNIDNAAATLARRSGQFDKPEAVLEIIGVESTHEPLLMDAMQKGLSSQVADMQKYIERKIAERAKAHSGR